LKLPTRKSSMPQSQRGDLATDDEPARQRSEKWAQAKANAMRLQ